MTPTESPPTLSHRGVVPAERRAGRLVVWVRGEQDISTAAALSETLAGKIALDDRDLVVDLSGVRFMDASTIGVLVRTCRQLRARSRSLVLRSPSVFARQILDICGLADLIDQDPVDVGPCVALRVRWERGWRCQSSIGSSNPRTRRGRPWS